MQVAPRSTDRRLRLDPCQKSLFPNGMGFCLVLLQYWYFDCLQGGVTTICQSEPVGAKPSLGAEDYAGAFLHGFSLTRGFLARRGAQADEAEEIAQAAWAKAWECREQLRDPNLLLVWVNTIAKNMFWNGFRRKRTVAELDETAATYRFDLEVIDVNRVLSLCDGEDRAILERHYLDGYTAEELGADCGLTASTIRVRLLRIRRALQQQLGLAPVCAAN